MSSQIYRVTHFKLKAFDKAQEFAQPYVDTYNQEDVLINEITSTAQLLKGDLNG